MGAMGEPTTPTPVYEGRPPPTISPEAMPQPVKSRYHEAARVARQLYSGAVAELLVFELQAATEFGWLLGKASLSERVREQVMREYAQRQAALRQAASAEAQ